MKGFMLFFASLFSMVFALYALKKEEPKKVAQPAPFERVRVQQSSFLLTESAKGSIEATQNFRIYSPIDGHIKHLVVDVGQEVQKGQTLAWISEPIRHQKMQDPKVLSASDLQTLLQKHPLIPVVAPFSGIVLKRPTFSGHTVSSQTAIYTMAKELRIKTVLDREFFNKIRESQKALIRLDASPDKSFEGQIVDVRSVRNDPGMVAVTLRSSDLPKIARNDMGATVQFVTKSRETASLIPNWLVSGAENEHVQVWIEDKYGEPMSKEIYVGKSNGTHVEILSPIQQSTVFLYQPNSLIKDIKQLQKLFSN